MKNSLRASGALTFVLILGLPLPAAEPDGFVSMFNGKDLTGWVNVNCNPGTFFVKDGEIITTGKPTGFLRTDRQYENFVIDFEWMHVNKMEVGNSGLFVWGDPIPARGTGYTRGIEVQVLVNLEYKDKKTGKITATSHGDLFSIWGATCTPDRPHPQGWSRCLPSENRCKGGGEWNHYVVTASNGVIKLSVNGKEVSGVSACNPRKGYLALESEGAECHFRNLKIKELPSTNPKPEEVADLDKGFKNLYFGDLSGWKADDEVKAHWKPSDWRLVYDGAAKEAGKTLTSTKEYGDFELIVDWRLPPPKEKAAGSAQIIVKGVPVTLAETAEGKVGQWHRSHLTIKDDQLIAVDGHAPPPSKLEARMAKKGTIALGGVGGPVEFANVFVRELKK